MDFSIRARTVFWVVVGLVLTTVCYWPGLHGGFVFDDFTNIVGNPVLRIGTKGIAAWWSAAINGYPGLIGRPLPMLSFAINFQLDELNPFYFKLVNLAIHLLTGLALGVLGYLLLSTVQQPALNQRSRLAVAALAAIVWLVHPFNLTSVIYVIQRMTGLATLFLVCGTVCYVHGRMKQLRHQAGWKWILAGLLGCGSLAVLSKEIGFLLPLYLLVVESVFFRFQGPEKANRKRLLALFGVALGLPLLALLVLLALSPDTLLGGYQFREFTLAERLLTEPRVLLWYLRMLVVPDTSQMGIYLDDIPISRSLLDPPSTLPAILLLLGILAIGVTLRRKVPIAAFACLWFLAGHAMESTIIPLEIAFEHRNYLPGYGVLLALAHTLLRTDLGPRTLRIRHAAAAVWIGLLAIGLTFRAHEWGDDLRHAMMELEQRPLSVRNNMEVGTFYVALARIRRTERTQFMNMAIERFEKVLEFKPDYTAALIANLMTRLESGREIPPSLIPDLQRALTESPIDASSVSAADRLIECQLKNPGCVLPEQTYMSLIEAVLQNPTLIPAHRAAIYVNAADYQGLVLGRHQRALEYARLAMESVPRDLRYRFYYIIWLTDVGDLDTAEEQLEFARKMDILFARRDLIAGLGTKIQLLRRSHRTKAQ